MYIGLTYCGPLYNSSRALARGVGGQLKVAPGVSPMLAPLSM